MAPVLAAAPSGSDDLPVIEVFRVGPDGALVQAGDELPTAGDIWRHLGHATADTFDHARQIQARRGQRLGPARRERRGDREDVVHTTLADPGMVARAILANDPFAEALPYLRVHPGTLTVDRYGMRWRVSLGRGAARRGRNATLRIHPTPSANVTVIELIPDRPKLLQTRSFVRRGVVAAEALGRRLRGHALQYG